MLVICVDMEDLLRSMWILQFNTQQQIAFSLTIIIFLIFNDNIRPSTLLEFTDYCSQLCRLVVPACIRKACILVMFSLLSHKSTHDYYQFNLLFITVCVYGHFD